MKGEVVNKTVLLKKIKEYFKSNPKKTTAIFESAIGDGKTFWKVTKKGSSFRISEVKTSKKDFTISEASPMGPAGTKLEPKDMPRTPTKIVPKATQDKTGVGKSTLASIDPGTSSGSASSIRKPVPMDGGTPSQAMSSAEKQKIANYASDTKSMLDWSPGSGPTSQFSKTLQQTKDLKTTLKKMPADHFKRNFGWTGAQSADQLIANQSLYGKAVDNMAQHNPYVAQMLGKKAEGKVKTEARVLSEASPAFSVISKEFMDGMSTFDHVKLTRALKTLQANLPKLQDPKEIEQAGKMSGVLTNLVDSTTAQVGGITKTTIKAGKENSGKKLKEADDKDAEASSSIKDAPTEDSGEEGLESPSVEKEKKPDAKKKDKEPEPKADKPEDDIVNSRLSGQMIKSAKAELANNGGTLSMELVGTKIPAVLKWENSGKVVFYFKNRPYILQH